MMPLMQNLDDQKIDVVIKFKGHELLIHQIAKEEGIILV
jgi:hypothetical protein